MQRLAVLVFIGLALSPVVAIADAVSEPYALTYSTTEVGSQTTYQMQVKDVASGAVVFAPKATTSAGMTAIVETEKDGRAFSVTIRPPAGAIRALITLEVKAGERVVQKSTYPIE